MTALLDLFDVPAVPGLDTRYDVIAPAEEAELIRRIDSTGLSPFRFQQWTGKRLTLSFGWSYDFETGSFERAEPIPDWLEPIKVACRPTSSLPSS